MESSFKILLVDDQQIVLDLSLIHISEPTRLGMISYAVFCLKKKKKRTKKNKKQKTRDRSKREYQHNEYE